MTSDSTRKAVRMGEVRPGAYYDSIVLMELQVSLSDLTGVLDAGVVMGTRSNLDLLRQNDLLFDEAASARDEDLVIALRVESREAGQRALAAVDDLLTRRRGDDDSEYRPRSLESAFRQIPAARWVLVSVPGRYAADVARRALELDRSVFLYSDNVSLEDEARLKRAAASRGLLVLGPDCGTARIGGAGFGFVNRVRAGSIGLVGPSGTGLQTVSSLVHQGGAGVSQILGTGGRDLSAEIGGATTTCALELLSADRSTEVIVLVSKPPEPTVARRVLDAAEASAKPVIVYFQGLVSADHPSVPSRGRVVFARSLGEAAEQALRAVDPSTCGVLTARTEAPKREAPEHGAPEHGAPEQRAPEQGAPAPSRRWLRGLFSGGTLALEMLLFLRRDHALASNVALDGVTPVGERAAADGHVVVDLGADELTVGRLHPMIDFDLRLRRLAREAADPEVAIVFLDVVLGYGAHPDPAGVLEGAVREATQSVEVAILVVGTDEDPQGLEEVCSRLAAAGARVFREPREAFDWTRGYLRSASPAGSSVSRDAARSTLQALVEGASDASAATTPAVPSVDPAVLAAPIRAVGVGLEIFHRSLLEQGVEAVHLDWRPPAGGNQRLLDILAKMKSSD